MSAHPILFLSHSGVDTQTAHELKRRLLASPAAKAAGLEVWLDKDDLAVGKGWQDQLEQVITTGSTAFAVIIGTKGVVNWVDREVRVALSRATSEKNYPFIPVFMSHDVLPSLPPFASQFHGVHDPINDDTELGKLLRTVLGDGPGDRDGAGKRRSVKLTGSPFVGLRAMTEADSDRFFGREDELEALVETLRAGRLVAIVADSGSGKSSLAQAGLIPRIRGGALEDTSREAPDERAWQVVVMRPGNDPVENMQLGVTVAAQRLGLSGEVRAALRRRIDPSRTDRSARAEWVYALQCDLPATMTETALIIDQFEELLTQTRPEKRQPFIDWLMDVTSESATIPVRVVLTIRADYFNLCSAHEAFYERIKPDSYGEAARRVSGSRSTHFRLKALTASAGANRHGAASNTYSGLAAIVHRPLILAGHQDAAERDALLAAIRHDVSDRPGDLALVQMALYETWRESSGGRQNLVQAYSRVGGVAGALAHAAEEVRTKKLSKDEAGLLEAVLVRLVNLGETGGATRRSARFDEFDSARGALAEKLTKEHHGRLLLAGSHTIEICHEQLITQWPWWQNCLSAAAPDVRRLARLIQKAAEWSDGGRAKRHLATGAELDFFKQIAKQRPSWLSATEVAFVSAAKGWARFWRGVVVVTALALVGVGLWAYRAQREAQQALAIIFRTSNVLVFDLGQEFRKRNLPRDLLDRMLDRAIEGYDQAIQSDPKNAEGYRSRGVAFGSKRAYDRAIQDFDQAIRLDPGNARGYSNRGFAYEDKRDFDRAIGDFDQAIQLDPKDPFGYGTRGFAYEEKGDHDRAIRDFDQAIQLDPKDPRGYSSRGDAYSAKGDYDRAIRDFDQAIQLDVKDARGYGSRGFAYIAKGDYDRAIQDFDQAIQLDPKDPYGYKGRGNAYASKGDLDRAVHDYDQAIQLDPKDPYGYKGRGNAYAGKGDLDRAIQDFDQAIQLDPNDAYAYKGRGSAYARKGDFDRAIQDFDQAIQRDSKDARTYWNRGNVYMDTRDYDRALQDFDQAIQLDGTIAGAYRDRGNAYGSKAEHGRAIQDFDQAIQLDPNDADTYDSRGLAYLYSHDYDRAVQDFDRAIQLDPDDALAFRRRGNAQADKGDYDRALRDYDQAVRLDQNNASAYISRGAVFATKGDYNQAIQDFDQAIKVDPKDAFAYLSRGVAYFGLGNFNAAATAALRAGELEEDAYFMIWLYLARERGGEDGTAELGASAPRLKGKDWPYPVIELYLGQRSPAEVLSAASNPEEVCGAQFHGGEWHLLHGNPSAAAAALKNAVDICRKPSMDFTGASAELKRLTSSTLGR
jgi:tetratricopeptide (TPR) repeat protein